MGDDPNLARSKCSLLICTCPTRLPSLVGFNSIGTIASYERPPCLSVCLLKATRSTESKGFSLPSSASVKTTVSLSLPASYTATSYFNFQSSFEGPSPIRIAQLWSAISTTTATTNIPVAKRDNRMLICTFTFQECRSAVADPSVSTSAVPIQRPIQAVRINSGNINLRADTLLSRCLLVRELRRQGLWLKRFPDPIRR